MKTFARTFLVVISLIYARAENIVVPSDRTTQVGNDKVIDPFSAPGTIDSVYGSKNVSGPVAINGLAFRLDEASAGTSYDVVIPRVVIRMSTYSGTYNSYLVGPGYNGNKGPDDITVFDAPVHWITTDLSSGANPFDLRISFSRPFLYNPASGALLMDFTSFGPFSSPSLSAVDAEGHGDPSIGWLGDKSLANLVTQFDITPIPEPSVIWLMFVGTAVVGIVRTRA